MLMTSLLPDHAILKFWNFLDYQNYDDWSKSEH